MADSYVCSKAKIKCSCGDRISTLTVYPDRTIWLTGEPQANISDHISMRNIAPFGKCHTTVYPATGAATAAAHGKLTPMPCVPNTPFPWMGGKNDVLLKGQPALLKSSSCRCVYGGTITFTYDGQVDGTGKDVDKENPQTQEELDSLKDSINIEGILDGIQIALDVAGMVPVLGAAPDLLNAAISAFRGDWMGAGLSVMAAVPIIGDVVGGAKIAMKGLKISRAISKARSAELTLEAGKYIGKNVSEKTLIKKGICKSEAEVKAFKKSLHEQRKDFATDFYKRNGMPENKISSHVNGIDLSKPVKVKKIPPPDKLSRYEDPTNISGGSYFGLPRKEGEKIMTPRDYGIQPVVVKKEGGKTKVIRKKKVEYKIQKGTPQFEVLETTASPLQAPLNNNWSTNTINKLNWRSTRGGATQVYIPLKNQRVITFK